MIYWCTDLVRNMTSGTAGKEVKSFLQTVAFCRVFMRLAQGRTYADVTATP